MRSARVIFGVLGLLVGIAAMAVSVVGVNEDRGPDDFFTSDVHRLDRSSFAITSEAVDVLTITPGWVADALTDAVDLRVNASSNGGSALFVGIADSDDVAAYLAGVSFDEVDGIRFEGSAIDYSRRPGDSVPDTPGSQTIWVASAEGAGLQTVDWSIEQGEWSVVVMNADGSPGVDANVSSGLKLSNFTVVAWAVFVFGLLSLLFGGFLVLRRPRAQRPEPKAAVPIARTRTVDLKRIEKKVESGMGVKFFEWVNQRFVRIAVGVVVLTVVLAGVGQALGSTEEPSADPSGEIYETAERADDVFATSTTGIQPAVFIVEDPAGIDVLTRDALLEWKTNSESLRTSTRDVLGDPLNSHLVTTFNTDFNAEIDNVYSIADAVDAQLAGGLESATDGDVKVAIDAVLAADSPTAALRATMSRLATVTPGTVSGQSIEVWESPAFQALVVFDIDTFEVATTSTDSDVIENERSLEAERWLREVQTTLRGDQTNFSAIGLAIDFGLEGTEQQEAAAPFILGAVLIILLVVGVLLRSYWAAAYVGLGLVISTIIYKGIFALIGLKAGLLLGFIVPVSIISFGVDFFIHALGRAREAQVEGHNREQAYPLGLSAVFLALTLAALSSAVAFLSNAVSGIEMIVQFGIGSAIALLVAFAILGLLAPKLLLITEDALGPPRMYRGPRLLTKLGFFLTVAWASIVVMTAVGAPAIALALGLWYVLAHIYVPFRLVKRRNARAAADGKELDERIRGAGHGLKSAGHVVHFMARWRVVTLPIVVGLAVVGVWGALQVRSDFAFTDFFSSDSDAIRSIERQEFLYGDLGAGSGYIYLEGDLTAPATLQAMQTAIDEVKDSGVDLARDFDGEIEVSPNAATLVQFAMASTAARDDVATSAGVAITDADGDGLPDTAAQVAAIYSAASSDGLRDDSGQVVFSADTVGKIISIDGDTQATRIAVVIGTFTDGPKIDAAQSALEDAAANLRTATAEADIDTIAVSGEPITNRNTLDAFTKSMLISLPVALLLTLLLVGFMLRSVKYALVSVMPILLVVAWLYGFMYLAEYTINPITATIAAIAIGVGIDFATHFTVRFREELAGEPSRFPALRRAGEGTGGALTLSALTSIAGFAVLAAAPMPIFAVYGVLTAVMIALAVLVTLLVLPSMLLLVTPSLQGEEREQLEWELTRGEWAYEPHDRETALQGAE